jgi:predicted  nucleic acid-binding Zn-ribbon protein
MLEEVRKHIEELIARYEAAKVENERLREELHACKETGDALRRQVLELESTIDTLKLTEAFTAGGDNRAAKEKLDQLIREVDKCISWLEN